MNNYSPSLTMAPHHGTTPWHSPTGLATCPGFAAATGGHWFSGCGHPQRAATKAGDFRETKLALESWKVEFHGDFDGIF